MQNSKFYTLYVSLSAKEATAFRKYLNLVHANKVSAIRLFEHILKVHKSKSAAKKMDPDYISLNVFEKPPDDYRKVLLNTLSDLHLWLKEFLLVEKAKSNSVESQLLWLSILQERNMDAAFSKQVQSFLQERQSAPPKSMADYLINMAVQHLSYYYLSQNQEFTNPFELQKNLDDLERYTLAVKIRMACEFTHWKKLRPDEFEPATWQEKLADLTAAPSSGHPLLLLQQELLQLIDSNNPDQFDRVEQQLSAHAGQIAPKELDEILLYLHNYATGKIRKRETTEDYQKVHQLNKLAVKHELFIKKEKMPEGQFLNVLSAACKAKDFLWAESFIKDKSRYLPEAVKKDARRLAMAIIHNEKAEYTRVIQTLEDKMPNSLHLQIRSKLLLLIAYYETRMDAIKLFELCSGFEVFLSRNRTTFKYAVRGARNFLIVLKSLIRQKKEKAKIQEQIQNMELLYYRPWLLEKLKGYKAVYAAH